MRLRRIQTFLLIGSLATLAACSPRERTPEKFPYIFDSVAEYGHYLFTRDLDGDGVDERIILNPAVDMFGSGRHLGYIRIDSRDGKIIDQVNYPGVISVPLHFLDWDHDGKKEILVPYILNDSLFVSFVNWRGEKLFSFFLIAGQPRIEDHAEIAWDPNVIDFYLSDVDSDGREDLVTVMVTGYARMPRAVLLHSLPEGRLLGKKVVGATIAKSFLGDFDGNGRQEVVVTTGATNNGASAGGFDDQHCYLIDFELTTPPKVIRSRMMGQVWTSENLFLDDFDGDGEKEFLIYVNNATNPTRKARLELIDPATWETRLERALNEPLYELEIVDLDRDMRPEIMAISSHGDVLILDHEFEIVKKREIAKQLGRMTALPDLDGDGIEDIIVSTNYEHGFLLRPDLQVRALLASAEYLYVVQTGVGEAPLLLSTSRERGNATVHSSLLRLRKNRLYLWYRYGPVSLWSLGVLFMISFCARFVFIKRRNRLFGQVQGLVFETDNRGLALMKPDGCITLHNAHLCRLLDREPNESVKGRHFAQAFGHAGLIAFLNAAVQPPHHDRQSKITVESGEITRTLTVEVVPIHVMKHFKPHWLLLLSDNRVELELQRLSTWGRMAQRIAHDIKNPLTSVLLTLQRLQMEYRLQSPDMASTYDTYATKILERIESLRRMTRSFLKFINVEQLQLSRSDLNEFITDESESIGKNLPSDIKLEIKLSPKRQTVHLDHEQIQVLLRNLISNSVNAMPEGGIITISTHLEQNVYLHPHAKVNDYCVLEVQDTGLGIPESAREHLFERGFTDTENGTGLGLAIVKRIIEQHKGHIEVESEPENGTVMSVYFPASS